MAKSQPSTSSTVIQPTPEQKSLLGATMPIINNWADTSMPGYQSTYAGPTAEQTAGLNMATGQVGRINQIGQQGAATSKQLLGGYVNPFSGNVGGAQNTLLDTNQLYSMAGSGGAASNTLLNPNMLYADANPYLQSSIKAATQPIQDRLMNETLPGLRRDSISSGTFGGSRGEMAAGLAAGQANRDMLGTAAQMASAGYGQGLQSLGQAVGTEASRQAQVRQALGMGVGNELQRQATNVQGAQGALSLLPQTQNAQLAGAQTLTGVGDVKQSQQRAQLEDQAKQSLYNYMAPYMKATDLLNFLNNIPGATAVSQTNLPGAPGSQTAVPPMMNSGTQGWYQSLYG